MLAEAKTPDRLVAAARTVLGWMPGGLAIVCVIASAVFTVLTGGSGVTIIAIGGLLYPALRKQKYSEQFSLGLVTTGGSVGLLLPMSLPLLVYALVAHVDLTSPLQGRPRAGRVRHRAAQRLLRPASARSENVDRASRRSSADRATRSWELKWETVILVLARACAWAPG